MWGEGGGVGDCGVRRRAGVLGRAVPAGLLWSPALPFSKTQSFHLRPSSSLPNTKQ